MKVEKDYEELLKLFNKYKVKYCIIGAYDERAIQITSVSSPDVLGQVWLI